MTPLLSFENVGKRYPDGSREIVVLDGACFEIGEGVFTGVWGARRAGKSTLLRLMAGVESPDAGQVRFDGRDLAGMSLVRRERLLRAEIALMSTGDWHPVSRETVVEHVALSLGSSTSSMPEARRRARRVLDRVGIAGHADDLTGSLSLTERMRVILARALVREPRLLLVDEPASVPSLSERDALYGLLRELTRESGTTLVVASEEMAPLHGAEVVMSIGDGELCSTDERGTVVHFPGGMPAVSPEP
ncbi:MAG TPA: ATP-binding cassette domain-containing protein [Solirubrobacteraceae bacterium]|nr:ATP-binding cassette domain-containing protein [Solirubrobacteraceae bacterium]